MKNHTKDQEKMVAKTAFLFLNQSTMKVKDDTLPIPFGTKIAYGFLISY